MTRTEAANNARKHLEEQKKMKLEEEMKNSGASGEANPTINKIKVNTPHQIKQASKVMMESLLNKDGRFTVAEARVFLSLVDVYFRTSEFIETLTHYNRLKKQVNNQ